jgi:hypothetical protein
MGQFSLRGYPELANWMDRNLWPSYVQTYRADIRLRQVEPSQFNPFEAMAAWRGCSTSPKRPGFGVAVNTIRLGFPSRGDLPGDYPDLILLGKRIVKTLGFTFRMGDLMLSGGIARPEHAMARPMGGILMKQPGERGVSHSESPGKNLRSISMDFCRSGGRSSG